MPGISRQSGCRWNAVLSLACGSLDYFPSHLEVDVHVVLLSCVVAGVDDLDIVYVCCHHLYFL